MEVGFRRDAASYLLTLRLIPVVPFWLVNLVPAFFGVPLRTFFWTTLVGSRAGHGRLRRGRQRPGRDAGRPAAGPDLALAVPAGGVPARWSGGSACWPCCRPLVEAGCAAAARAWTAPNDRGPTERPRRPALSPLPRDSSRRRGHGRRRADPRHTPCARSRPTFCVIGAGSGGPVGRGRRGARWAPGSSMVERGADGRRLPPTSAACRRRR